MLSLEQQRLLAQAELTQLAEEGAPTDAVAALWQEIEAAEEPAQASLLTRFWEEAAAAREQAETNAREPSELVEIRAQRPAGPRRLPLPSEAALRDRLLGAWLGRCAGCMLGKPVEGWRREQIEALLQAADAWPLQDYFPPVAEPPLGLRWLAPDHPCLRGNITRAVRDDDTDYTILGLHILETQGPSFTPRQIAEEWLLRLPYYQTYTAERVAYRNFVHEIWPPQSALVMNPYREWIGAQIRADGFGYGAGGWPEKAAEFAWRDACVSHAKNGLYGEMFFAALIAAALALDDLQAALDAAFAEIPAECRLAEALHNVRAWSAQGTWEETWDRIMACYGHYHPVHTINNACLVLAALLHSGGDFTQAICLAVRGGLDTDCNGATAGSVMGALLGASALPAHWTAPLQDTLESALCGYSIVRISELAERSAAVIQRVQALS